MSAAQKIEAWQKSSNPEQLFKIPRLLENDELNRKLNFHLPYTIHDKNRFQKQTIC